MAASTQKISLDAVRALLAAHASIYRFREPVYQTVLLQDLRNAWNTNHRNVLDVGGGTGILAQAIQEFFPVERVTSIDVENRFFPSLSITTGTFDGIAIPFGDNSFDCVVLNNVLHHVSPDNRVQLLLECKRVAGPIYVKDHLTTKFADDFRLFLLDAVGNLTFGGMIAAHYLSLENWKDIATRAGYEIEFCSHGAYRSGLMAGLFPNTLECMLLLRPV